MAEVPEVQNRCTVFYKKNKIDLFYCTLLFGLALIVRLYFLLAYPHVVFDYEADAVGYFQIARSLITSWGLGDTSLHFPPFYPFLLGILSFLTNEMETAARLTAAITGALLVVPLYLVGRELYGRQVGLLGAVAVLFFGEFIHFSLQPLTQTTYLTLMTAAMYVAVLLFKKPSRCLALLLGLICGTLYLTRPEGVVFFAYIFVLMVIASLFNRTVGTKEKVAGLGLVLAGFFILSLPYINYLHDQTGLWTLSGKTHMASIGVDKSATLLPTGETLGESLKGKVTLADLSPTVEEFLQTYLTNMVKFINIIPERFPFFCQFFALAGFLLSLVAIGKSGKREGLTKGLQLALLLGGFASVLPVFAFSNLAVAHSYILPIFPVLFLWMARGLVAFEIGALQLLKKGGLGLAERLKGLLPFSLILVLYFCYLSLFPLYLEFNRSDFRHYAAHQNFFFKQTGLWLKNNTPHDAAFMSRWSVIEIYAGKTYFMLPDGTVPELVRYARKKGVDYIVIDSASVPLRRKQLEPLLNPYFRHQGLRVVYGQEKYGLRIIIYQVLQEAS